MWSRYVNLLIASFRRMRRQDQCELITRLSQIVTSAVAPLVMALIYQSLPLFVRVLILPAIAIAAWMIGTRIVSPVVIKRMGRHLSQ